MVVDGVFWLFIVAFAVLMTRDIWSTPRRRHAPSTGLDVLDGRYARGEISRDEYLEKRRDLLGKSTRGARP